MAEIYGLYSARDGIVRYVGQTGGTRADRFKQHMRDAWWQQPKLDKWFHSEWRQGYLVECALLKSCSNEVSEQMETEWIRKFPNLLNKQKVGHFYRGDKPPKVPEIDAYIRGHSFNHEGHVGVHRSIHSDRFFVLVYTGSGIEWLEGDQEPGQTAKEGGNIWFSDLARALNARDKHRQWQKYKNWPSDREL